MGEPVAAPHVLRELRASGVRFSDELAEVPVGATVVFPAYGVSPLVRKQAAERELRVIDTTCPLVATAHADAARYAQRGDSVLVVGSAGSSGSLLTDYAGSAAVTVAGQEDLPDVSGEVSFVPDPGVPVHRVMPIVAALRRRYPHLRGHHFDNLCEVPGYRAAVAKTVASHSELTLLLVGAEQDGDLSAMLQACGQEHSIRLVSQLSDLRLTELSHTTTIGLVSCRSAPSGLEAEVVKALSGLGPLSIRRHGVHAFPESPTAQDRSVPAARDQQSAQGAERASLPAESQR